MTGKGLYRTLMSLINIQSSITVQGDKLSKKNKHTGRKISSLRVQVSFFSENIFTTQVLLLFLYHFLLKGMSPIKIGSLSLVILKDFLKFKFLQNYDNFLRFSKSKIDNRTVL